MPEHLTPGRWVSGLQLQDREACALVEGQWMVVVMSNPQHREIAVGSLHPFAALRFNEGFVLPYACATTPHDLMGICESLDQSMHEVFLRRALADRTDRSMLTATAHFGSADRTLLRLALNRCASQVDEVLAEILNDMSTSAASETNWEYSTLTELIMHASDPALLLAAIRLDQPSLLLAASVRIAELSLEDVTRSELIRIARDHVFFIGPPVEWARHAHWVKAALCALPKDDATALLCDMLAQSATIPSVTANISEALEHLLVVKPRNTVSRRVRILVETLNDHATHAVIGNIQAVFIPSHISRSDRKAVMAVCSRLGIATTKMRAEFPKSNEATNVWESAAIANGYDYAQVRSLRLVAARVRLIEGAASLDTALLIEATTDDSEEVRTASLVRLADRTAWYAALQATGIDLAVLARKAPVDVLVELWDQNRFATEPAVVLAMLRRGVIADTQASTHESAAVRLAAAFASPNENVLATLIQDTDAQVALQASFRTALVEHWATGTAQIRSAPASTDSNWNRLVSVELPAREMDLRRGELARTTATSDPVVARAAIHAICDEPVLWSLQQNPELAEWATTRLVALTDASS
jgi:hypothetical protein